MRKAVVLLSGGMDSATCCYEAKCAGYAVYALTVNYGQRAQKELDAARYVAGAVGAVKHIIYNMDLTLWGGSALTDNSIAIPVAGSDDQSIPVTYVPARNTIMLSLALSWAEVLGAEAIYIGVNSLDYSGYPDCRPEFIATFQTMADLATKRTAQGEPIRLMAPLQYMSKADIVRRASDLGLDINKTWSCYAGTDTPCGLCDSCRLRNDAISLVENEYGR